MHKDRLASRNSEAIEDQNWSEWRHITQPDQTRQSGKEAYYVFIAASFEHIGLYRRMDLLRGMKTLV